MHDLLDFLYQTHILSLWYYLSAFIVVTTLIVFIHELGHYAVAKACGVRISAFSIGFGKEVIGWNDRSGTRWRIASIPMGGYVQMHGDQDPTSAPDDAALNTMSKEEKQSAFHYKPLWQKALIVLAGPMANFILAIVIMTGVLYTYGERFIEPVIGGVVDKSVAQEAGLKVGDRILMIDDQSIESFTDIQAVIAVNIGTPVTLKIQREGPAPDEITVNITPRMSASHDMFGNEIRRPVLGIYPPATVFKKIELSLPGAVWSATKATYALSAANLKALGQIIIGDRSVTDLGGPLKIAQYSGQAAQIGTVALLHLVIILSIGLGLINLLPIPALDGGHLLYYAIEAVKGGPVAHRYQAYGMKIGFAFMILLAIMVTLNDARQILHSVFGTTP